MFQIPVGDARTHFSGYSSRTRLDPSAVRTRTHTHWTGFLDGVPEAGKGWHKFPLGNWKGQGVLLSEMLPVGLTESGGGIWKKVEFKAVGLRSGPHGRLEGPKGH